MEVMVKNTPRKIKHPQDDPLRKKKESVGLANLPNMKFENDAEKRDYFKRVNSNPMNTVGRPAFYPALEIRSSMSEAREAKQCKCGGCCTYQDGYICPRCGEKN